MAYSDVVLADSPLAYWRLGESAGTTMADSSGNSHPLTMTATVTGYGATGLLTGDADKSWNAAGSGSHYGTTPDAAWLDASSFTVEAWINPDVVTSKRTIISRDTTGGGRGWKLETNGTLLEFEALTGTFVSVSGTTPLAAGTTYHVAASWDGTTLRVYRNGVLDGSGTPTLNNPGLNVQLVVGAGQAGSGGTALYEHFDGRIDEVAFYGSALSADRLWAHYVAGVGTAAAIRVAGEQVLALESGAPNIQVAGEHVFALEAGASNIQLAGEHVFALEAGAPSIQVAGEHVLALVPLVAPVSPYVAAVMADTPVMYLQMQEPSGTVADDATTGNHDGTYVNGVVLSDSTDPNLPTTTLGSHVRFDGTNDHVLLDNTDWFTPATSGFTFEAWVYVRSWPDWVRIFDFANSTSTDDMYLMANNSGGLNLKINGTTLVINRPDLNVWHHLVVTVTTGGSAIVYVDNTVWATGTVGSPTNGARQYKYLGRSSYGSDPYLSASMMHVALYHSVLSAARVKAHYAAVQATPLPGQVYGQWASTIDRTTTRRGANYGQWASTIDVSTTKRGATYGQWVSVIGSLSTGLSFKAWNGTSWVPAPLKVRSGSTWVDPLALRYWNGTAWVPPPLSTQLTIVAATPQSTYSSYVAANSYDGNDTTYWNSGGFPPKWIYYDLGTARLLTQVDVFHNIPNDGRPGAFRVEGSNDTSTWTQLADQPTKPASQTWVYLPITTGTAYRYVRLYAYGNGSEWWAVTEVRIMGS